MSEPIPSAVQLLVLDQELIARRREKKHRQMLILANTVAGFHGVMFLVYTWWSFALGIAAILIADKYDRRQRPGPDETPLIAYVVGIVLSAAIVVAIAAMLIIVGLAVFS